MIKDLNKKLNHLAHLGMQDAYAMDRKTVKRLKSRRIKKIAIPTKTGEESSYTQLSLFSSL